MTKENFFIRAKYDAATMRVSGYFPSDINYINNIIDDSRKTIDGMPFITISVEQHQDALGKNMAVIDGSLQEYEEKETTEQKKIRIKNELILSRQNYLDDTRNEAVEFLLQGKDYPKKDQREQAKKEIKDIQSANTIAALNQFSINFQ